MPGPLKEAPESRPTREGKVRMKLWLDPKALSRAQAILGTATDHETVEAALDSIDTLYGCLKDLPWDPLRDLEAEHQAEIEADKR
jgi:hypothetical protein